MGENGAKGRGKAKISDAEGGGISECSGRPVFIFLLLKKIGFGS